MADIDLGGIKARAEDVRLRLDAISRETVKDVRHLEYLVPLGYALLEALASRDARIEELEEERQFEADACTAAEKVIDEQRRQVATLTRERDEARAEIERLRSGLDGQAFDEAAESAAYESWFKSEWPCRTPLHNLWLAWKARAMLPAPPVQSDGVEALAWLIEKQEAGQPVYWSLIALPEPCFLQDHDAALRFSRRADAQAYIDDIGWTEAKPVEHMWVQQYRAALNPYRGR